MAIKVFPAFLFVGLATVAWSGPGHAQQQCEPTKSAAVRQALTNQLNGLGCDRFRGTVKGVAVGIDNAAHVVDNVCYVDGPTQDRVSMNATLRCKTSDAALIPASFSENLDARITIGRDCKIDESNVTAAGEIGKILVESAEFFGAFKGPLQQVVTQVCRQR